MRIQELAIYPKWSNLLDCCRLRADDIKTWKKELNVIFFVQQFKKEKTKKKYGEARRKYVVTSIKLKKKKKRKDKINIRNNEL